MRIFPGISARIITACSLFPLAAIAQNIDILEGKVPTGIYVETAYDGNDERDNCDWYLPSEELVQALRAASTEFGKDCRIDIRVRGTLNRSGARRFLVLVDLLDKSELQPAAIVLDSRGGDADAALVIARTIRRNDLFSRVPGGVVTRIAATDTAVCFSACIVIYAAGYQRTAEFNIYDDPNLPSRLGIHGPAQFNRSEGNYDTSAENREIMRIEQAFKTFFESVGVSPLLVDDMFAIPFDEIRLLSEEDVLRYGMD